MVASKDKDFVLINNNNSSMSLIAFKEFLLSHCQSNVLSIFHTLVNCIIITLSTCPQRKINVFFLKCNTNNFLKNKMILLPFFLPLFSYKCNCFNSNCYLRHCHSAAIQIKIKKDYYVKFAVSCHTIRKLKLSY